MTPDQRDLLHALGHLYLRHGQNRRALTLVLLASREAPDDPDILKTLAYAFLANRAPERALAALDRLREVGPPSAWHLLLESRALLQRGQLDEARRRFRDFVEARS